MIEENVFRTVAETIRKRRTWKVIGDVDSPVVFPSEISVAQDRRVHESIEVAGMAPFHYDRNQEGIAEPWRCHTLYHSSCRIVAAKMQDWFDDIKPNNKLPSMLSSCGALVLINWIPQFDHDQTTNKQRQVNEEHLAATSALVQNLLLLLTAAGLGSYWSSGGLFRTELMFDKLGIDTSERLLAAVFVDYQQDSQIGDTKPERIPGKHCKNRSSVNKWCREIEI